VNSCNFRDLALADLDFDRDLDKDLTDVLFLELMGDLLNPPKSLFFEDFTLTLCEERAEVIKRALYFDLAFSATFVR